MRINVNLHIILISLLKNLKLINYKMKITQGKSLWMITFVIISLLIKSNLYKWNLSSVVYLIFQFNVDYRCNRRKCWHASALSMISTLKIVSLIYLIFQFNVDLCCHRRSKIVSLIRLLMLDDLCGSCRRFAEIGGQVLTEPNALLTLNTLWRVKYEQFHIMLVVQNELLQCSREHLHTK